jgi:peptide-methionine (S)-S-oxide reductase
MQTIVFGGGCFWCTEAIFKSLKGVTLVMPGYAGGHTENADYYKVVTGKTGHAECIKIEYDPKIISLYDLLSVFFNTHDATTLNRQGADIGTQYRSIILYTSDDQKVEAENLIKELDETGAYRDEAGNPKKVVTEVKPLEKFFDAEEHHQDYYKKNLETPYCELVIAPKLEKLQKRFAELLKP